MSHNNQFKKNGVVYYYTEHNQIFVNDIDIPEGLETFTFCAINNRVTFYNLKNLKREFPGIKTINIDDGVSEININNSLFPNLENVKSTNRLFSSGPHLIYERNRLQNTFFHDEDSVVDMHGINVIDSGAFTGCKAKKSINNDKHIVCCPQDAFQGYEYLSDDGHVKSFGHIIVQSDKDGIIDVQNNTHICFEVYYAKEVILHSESDLAKISKQINIETLVLDFDDILSAKLCDFARYLHLKNIVINNAVYKSVDGVVYSADGRVLFVFPRERSGHYDVLPGTEIIAQNAFFDAEIESVSFPESLKHIRDYAFSYSNVKSLNFHEGLLTIGMGAFLNSSIKNVELPVSVAYVGDNSFSTCSLKSIRINSKVANIMHSFYHTDAVNKPYVLSLFYNNENFFLPFCRTDKDDEILSNFELLLFANSLTQTYIINQIPEAYMKQEIAIQTYKANPNDEILKYLRRTAKNIIGRMIKNGKLEKLRDFLEMNIMTTEQLNSILKKVENDNVTMKDDIIQVIKERRKSPLSTDA